MPEKLKAKHLSPTQIHMLSNHVDIGFLYKYSIQIRTVYRFLYFLSTNSSVGLSLNHLLVILTNLTSILLTANVFAAFLLAL